jgi:hypothetical protein
LLSGVTTLPETNCSKLQHLVETICRALGPPAKTAGLVLLVWTQAAVSVRAQFPPPEFYVDQSNETAVVGSLSLSNSSPIGQEFVPTFWPEAVELLVTNFHFLDPLPALQVTLRADTITGPIVSTGCLLWADNRLEGGIIYNLNLVGTNFVIGSTCVIEVDGSGDVVYTSNTYAQGAAYVGGTLDPSKDLWFREGEYIPEPSPVVLLSLSLLALTPLIRRYHMRH